MKILLSNRQRRIKIRLERLEGLARKALQALGLTNAELSILIVNDSRMRGLNLMYRGKDRTTDVLAFSMKEGKYSGINPDILGDIVISANTAKKQAEENGHGLYDEIALLLIHGILHLTGYDHERGKKEELRMRKKERELLNRCKRR
ncbi:MAG: rRNA maturation RNase YbeY [Nitrospirota bacterium]